MQALDDLHGRGSFAFGKGGDAFGQFHTNHQPEPAHFLEHIGMGIDELLNAAGQMVAEGDGVLCEAIALDDLQRLERVRTDQRRAAKRRAVCARAEDVLQRFTGPNGAHRQAGGEALGHRTGVRRKVRMLGHDGLPSEKVAGAEMAALHFVEQQQQVAFVTQRPQAK